MRVRVVPVLSRMLRPSIQPFIKMILKEKIKMGSFSFT